MIKLLIYYEEEDNEQEIYFPKTGGNLNELKMIIKKTFPNINGNFKIIREQDNQEIKSISNITFEEKETLLIRDDRNNENNALFFVDVTNPENKISVKIENENNEDIPPHLTVRKGINLIGDCPKHNQVFNTVNNSSICYNYDYIETNGRMTCPECNSSIECKNIGFFQCYYNFYGLKQNKNKKFEEFGKEIPDFENINIDEHNIVNINGESYPINKTKPDKMECFYNDENKRVKFVDLIFQIRIFK